MNASRHPRFFAAMGLASAALAIGAACSNNTAPAVENVPSEVAPATVTAPTAPGLQTSAAAMTTEQLVLLATPSVVRVETPGGVGSGFIVAEDGHILTNYHVIEGATSAVTVTLNDGAVLPAEVVGYDSGSDIAVLKINAGGPLPVLSLANLHDVNVGEDVVAIGYALDLTDGNGAPSVTRGIVSAKNRRINSSTISGAVQTDAAINHGNSGGPLISYEGKVVGVNTALAPDETTGGLAQNIGFAVGADSVQAVYEEILETGSVQRALLGIANFASIRSAEAQSLGLPAASKGILVKEDGVQPGGPAATAGLQVNDVITQIGDRQIWDESDLVAAMIDFDPGDQVSVAVLRAGGPVTLTVTLGEYL